MFNHYYLSHLIDQSGLKHTYIAHRSTISPGYLSMIRTGQRIPSLRVLISLSDILGVSPGSLIAGGGDTH